MNQPQQLLDRLDAIGLALAASGDAVALIGLGSVGQELARLDAYSDLDFFVIAAEGASARLIEDLTWLATVCPIAYRFRNTAAGYKVLFADGIFCEFAVFEPAELQTIPFTAARVVWQTAAFDAATLQAARRGPQAPPAAEHLVGEILTNLYVGLGRYRRGERLSAMRFIQGYAVDRILELAPLIEAEQPAFADPFGAERRFEQRFPRTAAALPAFLGGYDGSVASALAILAWAERTVVVDPAIAAAIRALA